MITKRQFQSGYVAIKRTNNPIKPENTKQRIKIKHMNTTPRHYGMGIEITPQGSNSMMRVYIDYRLPKANVWLGWSFGGMYAKWCVGQMVSGARNQFKNKPVAERQVETD